MAVAHIIDLLPDLPRKRWTRAECDQLERHGFIDSQRYELVEGELIDKMGKNQPHIVWLALLHAWFSQVFPARILAEATLDVAPEDDASSEPQPDLLVLQSPITGFLANRPRPSDVSLLLEVSDTSLALDTSTKARLYARADIADYWVVDIKGRRLLVFRQPLAGADQNSTEYRAEESVSPLAAPEATLRLADILPTEN